MNVTRFRQLHEESWRALEFRVRDKKQRFQSGADLDAFATLYRKVAGDLSFAQTYFSEHEVTNYLNALVTTAHNRLYKTKDGGFKNIWIFYSRTFPRMFRELGLYIALATLISLFGALFGYVLTMTSPLEAYHLLPSSVMNAIDPTTVGPHTVVAPIMSTIIMTHNLEVALFAFAGGITFGLYSVYSLWLNGVMLGTLAAVFEQAHKALPFWALIVPHGVTELTAIFIAGGAGLLIAHRMISPGRSRRGPAVAAAAKKGVQIVLGTIPMFVIAGSLEGFLTPSFAPNWLKFSVAITTAVVWLAYFSLLGRKKRPTEHALQSLFDSERHA